MKQSERKLLENLFDGLDRLFDRDFEVYDFGALLYATDLALKGGNFESLLCRYIEPIEEVVKSGIAEESKREKALETTNELRGVLNELL